MKRFTNSIFLLLSISCLSCVFAAVLSGQTDLTFKAGVSEVHVDAGVTDQNGRPITGLIQNDFRVFDEGQEQILTGFAAEEQQLDLILLFDISTSMRVHVEKIASAAREAFHELRKGDRVSVMTFTSTAAIVLPFTTDLKSVEHSIQGILDHRFRGGTQIREGIYEAADYFIGSERSPRRRAIVVITDNLGGHKRSEAAVVTNLWEADAVLSGIVTPRHIPRGLPRPPGFPDDPIDPIAERLLQRSSAGIDGIAQKTGGDALHSDVPGAALAEMMHRIRSRYSLYYRMPEGSPGSLRSIRVELSSESKAFPSGQVQARRGYWIRGR